MTESAEEPLPFRDRSLAVPTSWRLCLRCGTVAADDGLHEKYHNVFENRLARAREVLRLAREQLAAQDARIVSLESDMAAVKLRIGGI